jgi:putative membrane protein
VSWAPVGMLLSVGLMWPLHQTPLYVATLHHPLLHDVVHLHMLATGCVLAIALVGPDPVPGRGGVRMRVATLVAALAVHGILPSTSTSMPPPSPALPMSAPWPTGG